MASTFTLSRRAFVAAAAAAPLAFGAKKVPVGLELYSVREDMKKDLLGTVRKVGQMGYQCVEFYSPYMEWSTDQAKEVRKVLDETGMKCYSTHNGLNALKPEGIQKAIDLNGIIGSKYVIAASAGRVSGLDGWKGVADVLTQASDTLKKAKMQTGFHNHQIEFKAIDGKRPIDVIAQNTPKNVVLQMDVGTIVEVGEDPVAYIKSYPGRIKSMHLKEYSRGGKGYHVLFGDGDAPWKEIFAAAEKVGGIEFYLIEQEGHELPPFETVERCLQNYRKLRGQS